MLVTVGGVNLARDFEARCVDAELYINEGASDVDLGSFVEQLARAVRPPFLRFAGVRRLRQLPVQVLANDLTA
jgi:hypothetical protein